MPANLSSDVSSSIPSTPRNKSLNITSAHLSRLPATPRTAALVEIRSRHAFQSSTSLTISSFSTLLAELNSATELDHRLGFEQDRIDKIEQFREDFMTGSLMRVQPPTLRDEGDVESYSDGTRRSSIGATTASSVNSSQEVDEPTASQGRRIFQMPLDPVSRGIIAEKTIKLQLAAEGVLLPHEDYASLARVARRAIKKALRLKRSVYVDPGLLHSVDWRKEYRERGWAAPGIRWGPFKPDLIKFEEVTRKSEEEERQVSWEVVEVKYAGKTRDVIYTNYKVQAIYYHLSLLRLLSTIPSLIPSHKVTFFISHDPLSPHYLEKPLSIRTAQAFVEHHLFVLLPEWLRAVKETEWKRLQDKLAEKAHPPTPGQSSVPTFLEKLQASQKKPPTSAPLPRSTRPVPSTPLSRSHTIAVTQSTSPPSPISDASSDSDRSFRSAPSSPLLAHSTLNSLVLNDNLPPLPPVDHAEEEELQELFGKIGFE